ncbi:MAG: Protein GrpE [Candidatus Wolfebacteria bacterium GW2011_GWE1_48_7]|uniref:Protein GrpE n=2 Tax=Candidatus Wolfeibacteriota TaxID=1752735 RepID=A0A0G1WGG8_9BACT|nr:MAG: GrpE protein HSP-70 cofactor, molecular chaperone GrpE [Candidatus Wolfebacteria bacterium GW2011_GWB1_47_1]KKU36532.1 MAG: Protein GrpE [Candidatus Wolfebacteria bacterium GW2011_GWC2_46_275]KKU42443.1 MAG: Protein GrpE [Candidatus Wolfebacteria bacterium GW2011_GWB2_46_69]KKU54228.1 MAG: Protein GrpE [Candidatus Wolfebacteria bacterium GW2011_GWC1_47_103]KKU59596.1 MAG: Protein GrpE [Candidatus Wolfebacteria bacterium GW2011_GWE2_47_12]KKU66240.1 MAG: Protein GrpE [Candidatus Wolfeba
MEDTTQYTNGSEDSNNPVDSSHTDQLTKERDEYLDGWQRSRAELVNYKKDEAKRLDDMMKLANGALIRDLIMVIDNFELAIMAMEKQGSVEKGIYLIKAQLEDILKQYGLEKMPITVGEQFDPTKHEAVASIESELSPDSVVEEVERGYYLHGKLIRPSRVKVAR